MTGRTCTPRQCALRLARLLNGLTLVLYLLAQIACGDAGSGPGTTPQPTVASVSVVLASPTVIAGRTTQATATLRDAANNVLSGREVSWTSSNAAAATVSSSGLVTALAAGTVTITATSEGRSGSATLVVTAAGVVSLLRDSVVVVSVPSLTTLWNALDPANYPNVRIQPSGFRAELLLQALAPWVRSDAYDFVVPFTVDSVPGWINSGRGFGSGAGNIGHLTAERNPPSGWPRLRSMPQMNWIGYFDPAKTSDNYATLSVFHEIGHQWVQFITGGVGGPRAWKPGDPLAHLAGASAHWSWNWLPDATHPGFRPPGIMYSGPTDSRFNAFDLYLMGLMPYAEVSAHTYTIHEDGGPGGAPGAQHQVTIDTLITGLRLSGRATGNGRRIPDTDPSMADVNTLLVFVTTDTRSLSSTDADLLMHIARRISADWQVATWGRSRMNIQVLGR